MSKELEALKRFRENAKFDTKSDYYLSTKYIDDNDIIETALKEKETPTETFEQFVGEPSDVIYKKLKALKIIKEKNVIISLLKDCSNFQEYNDCCNYSLKYVFKNFYPIDLTQEEFDLLREVLL